MKILFMGTPDFAVESLSALVSAGHDVCAVVTKEDAPRGRKMVMTPPPVKTAAISYGIPVIQPKTLRDDAFAARLAEIDPELIVVAAYGKILPKNVLDYPVKGCVNVHGSLLPSYRGAAPIQRALMNGDAVTGITTMFMDEGMDTGDMLLREETEISPCETYGELSARLAKIGAKLLLKTLEQLENGTLERVKQDPSAATFAPKIGKDEEKLDASMSAKEMHCRIMALSPEPLARMYTPSGIMFKPVRSFVTGKRSGMAPGTVVDSKKTFEIVCGDGTTLEIKELIPEGKGRMSGADFLRGRKTAPGDIIHFERTDL